ncbi:unnamed protein product [Haemonchus placei]|uniref:Uncharacterized protein n=1 Tax=Haemonchus placei TaxID=6290 RepID=A0A0N4WG76_HAEPC|nr:unnamed protein product [Haemonchus placei]
MEVMEVLELRRARNPFQGNGGRENLRGKSRREDLIADRVGGGDEVRFISATVRSRSVVLCYGGDGAMDARRRSIALSTLCLRISHYGRRFNMFLINGNMILSCFSCVFDLQCVDD